MIVNVRWLLDSSVMSLNMNVFKKIAQEMITAMMVKFVIKIKTSASNLEEAEEEVHQERTRTSVL